VLRVFAKRVRGALRSPDLVCRLGGEEFVIVMPDTPMAAAERVAERVRNAIAREQFLITDAGGQRMIPVTTSVGLAERGGDANPDALLRRADRALYASKSAGRNRVTAAAA
jgi:two-component system cell cycle response regulator